MHDQTLNSSDEAEFEAVWNAIGAATLRTPRAMLVGIILGWSLAQFGTSTDQASTLGLMFCILNIVGLGVRRLPQIALICFVAAAISWLHLPLFEHAYAALDRLLTSYAS